MNLSFSESSSDVRSIDVLNPQTVDALLAEEWTINPHSTLPSFLEMTMIEASQRVAWKSLKSFFSYLQDRLERWCHDSPVAMDDTQQSFFRRLSSKVTSLLNRIAHLVGDTILSKYGPEFRFLVLYWLERRSLLSGSAATIEEAIHGGRRVKVLTGPASSSPSGTRQGTLQPMEKHDGIRLALLMALGHYFMERGELLHQQLMTNYHSLGGRSGHVQKFLIYLYPFLYSTTKGFNLIQKWRYLLGQSVFFDAYSRWLNLVLRRVVADDLNASTPLGTSDTLSIGNTGGSPNAIVDLPLVWQSQKISRVVLGLLTTVTGISWIARLQMMRQQLRREALLKGEGGRSSLAPPNPWPAIIQNNSLPKNPPTHCPLCHSPRINPTASTGGYVFCLTCLTTALRTRPFCPITGKACPESSIVRLFEPHGN